jgi:protein-tyrosine phosphatase
MGRGGFSGLCDLTAELPAPRGAWRYAGVPCLDLVPPDAAQLAEAARRIEALRGHGPVLVCCALGYSRSAAAVAAWLLLTGRAADVDAAVAILRTRRPRVILSPAHRAVLAELATTEGWRHD